MGQGGNVAHWIFAAVLLSTAPSAAIGVPSSRNLRSQAANLTAATSAVDTVSFADQVSEEVPQHSGSPGHGEGHMVPRTEEHHGEHHWTYAATHLWSAAYPQCEGKSQSPVNIVRAAAEIPLEQHKDYFFNHTKYHPLTGLSIENGGHNVQVNGEFGTLTLPDGEYELKQFNFHFPSEHEVDGKVVPGEMHMVHQKVGATGTYGLAVIGILLDIDAATRADGNLELAFLSNLGFGNKLPHEGEKMAIPGAVDLSAFAGVFKGGFWHYQGSLTTPPCSETVHWYVMQQPAAVTGAMIVSFKGLFPSPSNNRPVQALNSRTIVSSEVGKPGEFVIAPKSAGARASVVAAVFAAGAFRMVL